MVETAIHLKDNFSANLFLEKDTKFPFNFQLSDCELIIYDEKKDTLKVLSFVEKNTTGVWDTLVGRNNPNDILIFTHQKDWGVPTNNANLNFKIKKHHLYPFVSYNNYDHYYNKRRLISHENQIDQLMFRTSGGRGDEVKLSELGITCELFSGIPIDQYCEKAIKYKAGLQIPGCVEMAHREFEYFAMGIPTIRLKYTQEYDPPLIPDFHYISVERGDLAPDMYSDCTGGDEYIKKYKEKFDQVKNDKLFLNYIAKNARKYYLDNCSVQNRLKSILNKLEIK